MSQAKPLGFSTAKGVNVRKPYPGRKLEEVRKSNSLAVDNFMPGAPFGGTRKKEKAK